MMTWIDDIVAALELSADTTYALQLCLEEAVVNVISYGFEPDSEHDVRIAVWRDGGIVRAEITDDGMPFDPLAQELPERPGDLGSAQIGGLGIKLMRNFASNIAYQRAGSSNRLTLTFTA